MTNHEIFALREKAEHEQKIKLAEAWLRKMPWAKAEPLLVMSAVAAITEASHD